MFFSLSLFSNIRFKWGLPNCRLPEEMIGDELFNFGLATENQNIWTPRLTHANAKDEPYPFKM